MKTAKPTLNIIGCGRLGRSLGKLWHSSGAVEMSSVCNNSLQSGQQSCEFIGGGNPVSGIEQMPQAQLWLIATPDRSIAASAQNLASGNTVKTGDVVFHCRWRTKH